MLIDLYTDLEDRRSDPFNPVFVEAVNFKEVPMES